MKSEEHYILQLKNVFIFFYFLTKYTHKYWKSNIQFPSMYKYIWLLLMQSIYQ